MLLCPKCDRPIPPEDINIPVDTAMCRRCNTAVSISQVVRGTAASVVTPVPFNPAAPPDGAWYRDDGMEKIFGATTRSSAAKYLMPFFIIWGGATIGGIYGSQIASGKFDLLLSLFGLIFLAGACAIGSFAMLSFRGRVEVRVREGTARIFVGVGKLGWHKSFDVSQATSVREDWSGWSRGKKPQRSIVIDGVPGAKFGSMLTSERRQFVMQALQQAIAAK